MTQIAVAANTSASVSLAAGSKLFITGQGTYRVGPLGTSQRPTVDEQIDTMSTIGPFGDYCTVFVLGAGSGATYEVVLPTDVLDQTGRPASVSGAGNSPVAFTTRDMLAADAGGNFITTMPQTVGLPTGLPAGFNARFKGLVFFSGSATISDERVIAATNPYCQILNTGPDAYSIVGTKARTYVSLTKLWRSSKSFPLRVRFTEKDRVYMIVRNVSPVNVAEVGYVQASNASGTNPGSWTSLAPGVEDYQELTTQQAWVRPAIDNSAPVFIQIETCVWRK